MWVEGSVMPSTFSLWLPRSCMSCSWLRAVLALQCGSDTARISHCASALVRLRRIQSRVLTICIFLPLTPAECEQLRSCTRLAIMAEREQASQTLDTKGATCMHCSCGTAVRLASADGGHAGCASLPTLGGGGAPSPHRADVGRAPATDRIACMCTQPHSLAAALPVSPPSLHRNAHLLPCST